VVREKGGGDASPLSGRKKEKRVSLWSEMQEGEMCDYYHLGRKKKKRPLLLLKKEPRPCTKWAAFVLMGGGGAPLVC